ncbi:hypothetical protein BDV25DRAFT_135082 [Aspergillus avenaceus]|uniref:Protein kinase domain-containing protein n=1 Tax=Aspergillus avenaceus TaxID=36643 RepID=A0A5N6U9N8_ASPAV|nr:hypothetical protein BDV25DRAFT_135082 [Aspergillus avenaceus]
MEDITTGIPTKSSWKVWLKRKDEYCPFLKDWTDAVPEIEFLELLADAVHSYMFKVRLHGKTYALKLYTVSQPLWSRFETIALVKDAFIVESRAYNSLIERNLGGVVGPHCHGWLAIDKNQEIELDRQFNLSRGYTSTDTGLIHKLKHQGRRPWLGFRQFEKSTDPVRGLLLDYIDGTNLGKATLTSQAASNLRSQLEQLHSLFIAHGDLFPRNIMVARNGRPFLIDFSSAHIYPSVRSRTKEGIEGYMYDEKCALEYYLFQLQQLQRHRKVTLTDALNEEDAYGGRVSSFIEATKEDFVD